MFQSHYVALYLHSLPFSLLRSFDGRFPMCDVRCGVDADSRAFSALSGLLAAAVHQISCPRARHKASRAVAGRAVVSVDQGEHHAALGRLVAVVQ
jgi:hypothetical protein